MRIAFCHNIYQQPGGEDQVFHAESSMMEEQGHEVFRYTKHNDEINRISKLSAMRKTFWNKQVMNELIEKFAEFKPDVVHFTNTFPLISPSAYKAARQSGAAVVQSLHNFRLICPGSLLLRDGKNCEICVGKWFAWPAIWHKCYRNNLLATAATAGANSWHRMRGTLRRFVNRFIALTNFSKTKFVEGGLDASRIVVKQNFASSGAASNPVAKNGRALFVGRLSPEKGLSVLLECWKQLESAIGLDIVGDGPMMNQLLEQTKDRSNIQLHGQLDHGVVKRMMAESSLQIVPSNAYETFGMVVVEAFSVGTPVIVSDHGSLSELVESGKTGYKFEPGNASDLRDKVKGFFEDPGAQNRLGSNAYQEFRENYTKETNCQLLQKIYEEAIEESKNEC